MQWKYGTHPTRKFKGHFSCILVLSPFSNHSFRFKLLPVAHPVRLSLWPSSPNLFAASRGDVT
jgi:hypothetical protein